MRAWVYRSDYGSDETLCLRLEERPVPTPGPKDVLLKILKVSVCGTDEMLFAGNLRRAQEGIVPGHELCGEIVEVGSGVTGLQPGRIVAAESHYSQKGASQEGVIGLWPPTLSNGSRGRVVDGGYAEFAVIPSECAHVLPDGLQEGNFWPSLFEPAGNDFFLARLVQDRFSPSRVGVFGCGPHGIYAQIFLRHFGVPEITAFEIDPDRRRLAREVGCADAVIDPGQAEGGFDFDVTVDAVGKDGQVYRQACRWTRPGGAVILFGLFHKEVEIDGVSANDLIFQRKELTVDTGVDTGDRSLTVVGVTGREGIWPDLIRSVAESPELQRLLMMPVDVEGPLDSLKQSFSVKGTGLKRAFWGFSP